MICGRCKETDHKACLNYVKLGQPLSTWCDCQHKEDPQAQTNRDRLERVRRRPTPQRDEER